MTEYMAEMRKLVGHKTFCGFNVGCASLYNVAGEMIGVPLKATLIDFGILRHILAASSEYSLLCASSIITRIFSEVFILAVFLVISRRTKLLKYPMRSLRRWHNYAVTRENFRRAHRRLRSLRIWSAKYWIIACLR